MTKRDVLYRGTVHDLVLAPDGRLSGILFTKPHRFKREKYLDDLKVYLQSKNNAQKPNPENYWTQIPGHAFLVMAESMETLNLRSYEREDEMLWKRLTENPEERTAHGTTLEPVMGRGLGARLFRV